MEPVIRVRDLRKRFGNLEVLRGIYFEVGAGEIFVIMGASGSGKTVLLKHLIGLLRPDWGEIYIWNIPVHKLDDEQLDEQLRKRIGVVFQSAALFDSLTVGENVAFPLRRHQVRNEAAIRQVVTERLRLVELESVEDKMPSELSGGMRKRVGIARALVLQAEIMFYDEPTSGLDPPTARTVDSLIKRLRDRLEVTSVVVTHDVDTAMGIGDRIALMAEGRLLAVGTPDEILNDPRPEVHDFLQHRGRRPAFAEPVRMEVP
jgi:phospholipid/cholesterol/gamma-HCH transport system ATP-binding protein